MNHLKYMWWRENDWTLQACIEDAKVLFILRVLIISAYITTDHFPQ